MPATSAPDPWDHLRYVMDAVTSRRSTRAEQLGTTDRLFPGSPTPWPATWSKARRAPIIVGSRACSTIGRILQHILSVTADAVSALPQRPDRIRSPGGMIFDSWGARFRQRPTKSSLLQYMQRIVGKLIKEKDGSACRRSCRLKGGGLWLESIATIGCDAVGLDWTVDIGEARRRVGERVALQGNVDPAVLFASPEKIAVEARKVLDSYGPSRTGHRTNLNAFPVHAAGERHRAGRCRTPAQSNSAPAELMELAFTSLTCSQKRSTNWCRR